MKLLKKKIVDGVLIGEVECRNGHRFELNAYGGRIIIRFIGEVIKAPAGALENAYREVRHFLAAHAVAMREHSAMIAAGHKF
jgi:hypothetical protein